MNTVNKVAVKTNLFYLKVNMETFLLIHLTDSKVRQLLNDCHL